MSKSQISIAQIAKLTGLSAPTVSKVINGRPGVSANTRERVETVLAQYGYERKPAPRGKTSNTIELVFSHTFSTSTIELVRGAITHASTLGIGITISEVPAATDRTEQFRQILDRNPLGVIFELEDVTEQERRLFRSRAIPYIIINLSRGINDDLLSVGLDNWSGGLLVGRHLTKLGHQRIGVITGPSTSEASAARLSGFRTALSEVGIGLSPEMIKIGDYNSKLALIAAEEFLTMNQPPTAIFAFNDISALCVLKVAARHKILIPDELSVIGFDDVFPANVLDITTIKQPLSRIAQEALDIIMNARNEKDAGQPITERRIILPTQLIERNTTSVPKI